MADNNELRSNQSLTQCFVRFFNISARTVDCIWINFRGHRVKYRTLGPKQFFDVNTYVSHPWIFRDSITNNKMRVMAIDPTDRRLSLITDDVFWPKACANNELKRQLLCIDKCPVFNLKERCFEVLRERITDVQLVRQLMIPNTIIEDFINYCQHIRSN